MIRFLMLVLLTATSALAQISAADGATIFKSNCSSCHDAGIDRVPQTATLKAMFRSSIRQTLESGPMKMQGAALSSDQLDAVISFLGVPDKAAVALPPTAFCKVQKPLGKSNQAEWQGWGANASNSRFANAATAGMTSADVPKLKLKWAFSLGEGDTIRSQAVAGAGRLFVANLTGQLYSLDAATGCIQWTFDVGQPVRSSALYAEIGKQPAVFFGGNAGNVFAVDASSGKLLWKT